MLMLSSLLAALCKRMARDRFRAGAWALLLFPQRVERIRVDENHAAPARELRQVQVWVELARGTEAATLFNKIGDVGVKLRPDPEEEIHNRLLRARVHDYVLGRRVGRIRARCPHPQLRLVGQLFLAFPPRRW